MAAHAAAECNPLYPVPKLMDEAELAAMYYVISDLTVFAHASGAQAG
jgi:hypothetical protein